jgi:hypothetical protein
MHGSTRGQSRSPGSSRSPRSPVRAGALLQGLPALLPGLIVALLVPALLLGSFDLHSSGLPHGALNGPSEVSSDARHPLAPQHLEASTTIHIPSCFTCLLQLKTSSGAVDLPALEPVPVVAGTSFVLDVGVPSGAPELRLRSRAPPAA